ncbi:MAG: alpha-hydroxy-acid oxidizing protein, partial [Spirochaetales bacterium]|nr:alpha-hydroxy-acid oxidizing protein [Spirochaetales bacterium]
PDVLDHFRIKRYAPNVPVFTNIGAVQLPQMSHDEIFRMAETLEVDGIAVHLNPAQEIFQPGGDTAFAGITDALRRFIERSPVAVLVKETGFGINPREVRMLRELGAAYVDVAGSGGTNWIRVEAYRHDDPVAASAAEEFDEWGLPTGLLLAAIGRDQRGILASGGIRTGMDVVRSLMLGAEAAGLALPFVRAVKESGVEGAIAFGRRLDYAIRTAMTLTGCRRVADFRTAPVWLEQSLRHDAEALRNAVFEPLSVE